MSNGGGSLGLVALAMSCLAPLVVLAVAALVLVRVAPRLGRAMDELADPVARLDDHEKALAPWTPGAVGELAYLAVARWQQMLEYRASGTIAGSDGRPLVAFAATAGFSGAEVHARTTAHRLHITLRGSFLRRSSLRVEVDGTPLGSWDPTEGTLSDATGQSIGRARRGSRQWLLWAPFVWQERWYDVEIRGRVVASVLARRSDSPSRAPSEAEQREPKVRLTGPVDSESERWLLAIAVMELGYSGALRSQQRFEARFRD